MIYIQNVENVHSGFLEVDHSFVQPSYRSGSSTYFILRMELDVMIYFKDITRHYESSAASRLGVGAFSKKSSMTFCLFPPTMYYGADLANFQPSTKGSRGKIISISDLAEVEEDKSIHGLINCLGTLLASSSDMEEQEMVAVSSRMAGLPRFEERPGPLC